MPAIELFTANFSPFGQRVRLALLEKGLDFLHTEIDLTAKPEWFLIISPLGQVPVIRHEDRFVSDSSVILEYLEDVYPIPSLRPRDPKTRAVIRFWTDYADEKLVAGIVAAVKAEGEKRGPAREQLREILAFIEREGMADAAEAHIGSVRTSPCSTSSSIHCSSGSRPFRGTSPTSPR